jgi:hypothetical protein
MATKTQIELYVDALFASLEAKVATMAFGPIFLPLIQQANIEADQLIEYLASQLGHVTVLTVDVVLTALIDGAMAAGKPALAAILTAIKAMVDQLGAATLEADVRNHLMAS